MSGYKGSTEAKGACLHARMHKKSRLLRDVPFPTSAQSTGKRGGHAANVTKQLRKLSQGL